MCRLYKDCLQTEAGKTGTGRGSGQRAGSGNGQKRKRSRRAGSEGDMWHHLSVTPVRAVKIRKLSASMGWPRCEDEWTLGLLTGAWGSNEGNSYPQSCKHLNETFTQVSEGTQSRTFVSALSVLAESWGQSERHPTICGSREIKCDGGAP